MRRRTHCPATTPPLSNPMHRHSHCQFPKRLWGSIQLYPTSPSWTKLFGATLRAASLCKIIICLSPAPLFSLLPAGSSARDKDGHFVSFTVSADNSDTTAEVPIPKDITHNTGESKEQNVLVGVHVITSMSVYECDNEYTHIVCAPPDLPVSLDATTTATHSGNCRGNMLHINHPSTINPENKVSEGITERTETRYTQ